ncbi:response regulator transcription factor [Cupriavidus necator]|uniref:DNA-binding response regulator n=1 Tax=Cupriavidus necator TaxID=106590 RepID=A0A367PIH4_CUPNE|nr:response regulator transcription factor [Cupriavidus necator]QQX86599.1 response regulator transcription factor [Cupriavidus necator]RCJ06796.1 DNA-binding response regulator [Cupriavidus necator]
MIRVLMADDHAIVRSGLKQILSTTTDVIVAAEAADGGAVLEQLRAGKFDLLLLDMSMPGISGIDLIRRVQAEWPSLAILILSMHNEAQVASRALRAGAWGYVTKDSEPEILLGAIRKLASGGKFIDPALVDAMVFYQRGTDAHSHEVLSDREFQVLQQLAAGQTVNEIAEAFSLSAKTISTYKARLMQKLTLQNNAELVRYALKHGLTKE